MIFGNKILMRKRERVGSEVYYSFNYLDQNTTLDSSGNSRNANATYYKTGILSHFIISGGYCKRIYTPGDGIISNNAFTLADATKVFLSISVASNNIGNYGFNQVLFFHGLGSGYNYNYTPPDYTKGIVRLIILPNSYDVRLQYVDGVALRNDITAVNILQGCSLTNWVTLSVEINYTNGTVKFYKNFQLFTTIQAAYTMRSDTESSKFYIASWFQNGYISEFIMSTSGMTINDFQQYF